ncbi:MAG TPA: amidohydrolase family protein [Candidatus Binatia bacterium]|jgi:predicted TIM-barrel fold metal-dependent hydrolase
MIIDADGHTHIPQEVFDTYLDKEFYRNRPRFITFDDGRGYYIIEGRVIAKPFGWGPGTPGSIAGTVRTRKCKDWDLNNVSGRLEDLDLEGIDLQVIYPNVLMSINSWEHAGLATAVSHAYNTWISEKCAQAGGRLRFAAVVALQDPKAASEELRRAVTALGAVGVMVPGTLGARTLDHPDLYPFWDAVEQLDVGVGVHTVTGMYPTVGQDLFDHFWGAKAVSMPLTLTTATVSLVGGGIADLFPNLRFGLLETGCGWLPYWIERMDEMHERGEKDPRMYDGILNRKRPRNRTKPSELFAQGRMVVSCEPGEIMLPAVIAACGDQCIMYASDYPHGDSKWPETVSRIRSAGFSEITEKRILGENAARLYKLDVPLG